MNQKACHFRGWAEQPTGIPLRLLLLQCVPNLELAKAVRDVGVVGKLGRVNQIGPVVVCGAAGQADC